MMTSTGVVIGIDAGGSRTRARAVAGGQVVHEGTGGPGNPLTVEEPTLLASYRDALAGCPAPARVGACVAGTGSPTARDRVTRLLGDRFPDAVVRVAPDYVAAFCAAPPGTDVCVIAGTGSLVCGASGDSYMASGGRGWIVGDHGSAARLGRAALDWFLDDPDAAPPHVGQAVQALFGTSDWRHLVGDLHAAASPAAFLARAAPLLTEEAGRGAAWAVERLEAEMHALASTTARHIGRHVKADGDVMVALAGGVWSSRAAGAAFTGALEQLSPLPVLVRRSLEDPIVGAVRFAMDTGS